MRDPARSWHLVWSVGLVALGALLLTGFGVMPGRVLAALALAAAPGLIGYLWPQDDRASRGMPALWAASAICATALAGGVAGPLAVWCAMPLLAGALFGALAEGAGLSAAALAISVLLQVARVSAAPPEGPFNVGLAVAALAAFGTAAAWVFHIQSRRDLEPAPVAAAPAPLLRELEPAAGSDGPPPPRDDGEASARIAALEAKLKATELDRSRTFAALTKAEAALREVERARDEAVQARLLAEDGRDEAEAQAANKARFLANMSHELRTPLNAIMGFSDIMRARMFGELQGKYAEYAELIHESGRHLMDLINDVLDMSKIEADRYILAREVFDGRDAVNGALRLVRLQADEAGIQLRGVLPQEPLPVDADRRAIKQIVLNLVSNALKFTPSGGSVTVTAQAVGNAFEIVVSDTGVGIAKEDIERLGRPFEQAGDSERRSLGTGLGLSLVKAFAGLHGGEMNIESVLGEGAAVTVRLPVLVQPEPAPAPPPTDGSKQKRSRKGQVIPLNLKR